VADLPRASQSLGRKPALLLVDMSNGFTSPESPLGCACDAVVAVNARLLQAFRSRGLPVYFSTVAYDAPDQAAVFRARLPDLDILQAGSRWTAIDERLAPQGQEVVISKHHPSAFFGTDLASRLRAEGVDSLVVTGLTTSGCVRATAVDGLQHDFPVFVVADATADRNTEAHHANLHDLHAKYADVVRSDELLQRLDEREGTS
jgi:nicotinamidase-related amidase